jgi:hypothetical protein
MVWTEDQSHDNIQSNNPQPCTNSLILWKMRDAKIAVHLKLVEFDSQY